MKICLSCPIRPPVPVPKLIFTGYPFNGSGEILIEDEIGMRDAKALPIITVTPAPRNAMAIRSKVFCSILRILRKACRPFDDWPRGCKPQNTRLNWYSRENLYVASSENTCGVISQDQRSFHRHCRKRSLHLGRQSASGFRMAASTKLVDT